MAVAPVPGGTSFGRRLGAAPSRTADFSYDLACSTHEVDQALRLLHDQYVARRYMRPHPTGWRLHLHHALPPTRIFVARERRRVVGTVTLIPDTPLGLPMDGLYEAELAPLRAQQRLIAEVSGLAIANEVGASGLAILTSLVRHLLLYAIEVRHCDDICIAINPRHVGFYRRLFPDACQIGGRRAYRSVNGAPAVALRIDLRMLRSLIPSVQAETAGRSTYHLFFDAEDFETIVDRLRRAAAQSQLTARQVEHFFSAHPALSEASESDQALIQSLCPEVDVAAVIDRYRSATDQESTPADFAFAFIPA